MSKIRLLKILLDMTVDCFMSLIFMNVAKGEFSLFSLESNVLHPTELGENGDFLHFLRPVTMLSSGQKSAHVSVWCSFLLI